MYAIKSCGFISGFLLFIGFALCVFAVSLFSSSVFIDDAAIIMNYRPKNKYIEHGILSTR